MTLTTPEGREIHTALEEAIFLKLGGAVSACHQLGVSTQAVYKLLATGYVSSRATALRLQELTDVPAAELMQLAPWNPNRPPSDPKGKRGPKEKGLRSIPLTGSVRPAGGGTEAGREARAQMRAGVKGKRTPRQPRGTACKPQSKSAFSLAA